MQEDEMAVTHIAAIRENSRKNKRCKKRNHMKTASELKTESPSDGLSED